MMTSRLLLRACLVLVAFGSAGSAWGQDRLQRALRDFQVGESWIYDDWDAARKRAKAEGKPIFLVFRCVP